MNFPNLPKQEKNSSPTRPQNLKARPVFLKVWRQGMTSVDPLGGGVVSGLVVRYDPRRPQALPNTAGRYQPSQRVVKIYKSSS